MAKYLYIKICTVIFSLLFLGGMVPFSTAMCHDEEFGLKSEDGQITCKPCSDLPRCPDGTGVSIACGDVVPKLGTNIHCVPCVLGKTFSSGNDREPCQPCKSMLCNENEEILGSCLDGKVDTSTCSGVCKRGFYPRGDTVEDCQPCSLCPNASFARVLKCKNDGVSVDKQCVVGLPGPPVITSDASVQQLPSKKNDETKNKNNKFSREGEGYEVYGHPAIFSSLLIVIGVLVVFVAVVLWKRKCRKKTPSSVSCQEEVPLNDVHVDSGIDETDSYDGTVDLNAVASVRKRKTSTSSGERKAPNFTRQHSNSGSDFSDERGLQSDVVVNELAGETDVFEEKTSQVSPGRKRSQSGSSAKRTIFNRQNSNPVPEHKEERASPKRRMTFSSFTSIISGPKGTTEETTPILQDHNANEMSPLIVALPAETSSFSEVKQRLSGLKIGQLNAETHRQLCVILNRQVPNKDWRTLAGHMRYNSDDVKGFAQKQDPADALLEHWGTKEGNDVARLIELGRGIERHDVVQLLESVPDTTKV